MWRGVTSDFEWDEAKNRLNISKHGIDFLDVPRVFEQPLLVRRDDRRQYEEDRWIAMGVLSGVVIVTVYARRGPRLRIISARRANQRERTIYEQALGQTP